MLTSSKAGSVVQLGWKEGLCTAFLVAWNMNSAQCDLKNCTLTSCQPVGQDSSLNWLLRQLSTNLCIIMESFRLEKASKII